MAVLKIFSAAMVAQWSRIARDLKADQHRSGPADQCALRSSPAHHFSNRRMLAVDQRCFVDGEAYSRDTFDYLLTAPESVSTA